MKRALFVTLLGLAVGASAVAAQAYGERSARRAWLGLRAGGFLPTTDLYEVEYDYARTDRIQSAGLVSAGVGVPVRRTLAVRVDLDLARANVSSDFTFAGQTTRHDLQGGENWLLAGTASIVAMPFRAVLGAEPYVAVGGGVKYYHLSANGNIGGDVIAAYANGHVDPTAKLGAGVRIPIGAFHIAIDASDFISRFNRDSRINGGVARWQNDITLTGGIEIPLRAFADRLRSDRSN